MHQKDKASPGLKGSDAGTQAVGEGTKTIQAVFPISILMVPFLFLEKICLFIQILILIND